VSVVACNWFLYVVLMYTFYLGEFRFYDFIVESSSIAIFIDNIRIVGSFEHLVESNDVAVRYFPNNFHCIVLFRTLHVESFLEES
jgi:hypothetical protein